jgi:hypothetical protein
VIESTRKLLARKIQKIIGRLSTRQYLQIIRNNLLPNCPVTYHDVLAAEDIFGPDIGSLRDKTGRQTPDAVNIDKVDIPKSLFEDIKK